jgi:hypothetical protein
MGIDLSTVNLGLTVLGRGMPDGRSTSCAEVGHRSEAAMFVRS